MTCIGSTEVDQSNQDHDIAAVTITCTDEDDGEMPDVAPDAVRRVHVYEGLISVIALTCHFFGTVNTLSTP
jgi:hypothetical protein